MRPAGSPFRFLSCGGGRVCNRVRRCSARRRRHRLDLREGDGRRGRRQSSSRRDGLRGGNHGPRLRHHQRSRRIHDRRPRRGHIHRRLHLERQLPDPVLQRQDDRVGSHAGAGHHRRRGQRRQRGPSAGRADQRHGDECKHESWGGGGNGVCGGFLGAEVRHHQLQRRILRQRPPDRRIHRSVHLYGELPPAVLQRRRYGRRSHTGAGHGRSRHPRASVPHCTPVVRSRAR